MSQIMGLPAGKLLEDYTPGEKMAYTYNAGYQAAIADALKIVDNESQRAAGKAFKERKDILDFMAFMRMQIRALLEDKS